jgi:transposase
MFRHRLTDEQWRLIADLFPQPKNIGRPPSHPRRYRNGDRPLIGWSDMGGFNSEAQQRGSGEICG